MTETTITPADPQVKDFSKKVDVKFKIDDDIFIGVPNLAVDELIEFVGLTESIGEADMKNQPKFFRAVAQLVLTKESAEKFISRMADKSNPISIFQVMEIIPWVMGEYGMRPTEPSSDSSDGSPNPEDGTKLTVNLSPMELTSELSAQTDS